MRVQPPKIRTAALMLGLGLLAACGGKQTEVVAVPVGEVECMARAMYFESNRSSRDGMVAVGTVVLNRVHSEGRPAQSVRTGRDDETDERPRGPAGPRHGAGGASG